MGKTAIEIVRATGYTNAGTVEFLLDVKKNFYFLEVNARIQVEHPITEMVTGVDLVKWQIRVASGEKLILKQDEIHQRGHAIECRIYAEDPANRFLPSLGKILFMKNPEGPGVRVDSGIYSGYEVDMFYDPILAKLIVWGEDRQIARRRMVEALSDYIVMGIKTTIPFLKDVIQNPDFILGETATDFIAKNFSDWTESESKKLLQPALIAAAIKTKNKPESKEKTMSSPWYTLGMWRIGKQ